jgi:hypothetical protein
MQPMPWLLRLMLPRKTHGITLPPWGIFVRPGSELVPGLYAHEAVHWAQYQRMGAVRFYAVYLWQWCCYGYANHPMEIEARDKSGDNQAG